MCKRYIFERMEQYAVPSSSVLKTFLGKLTRNISLNKYKQLTAEKRGNGQVPLIIDELHECIPATESTESIIDDMVLVDVFNRFLASLTVEQTQDFYAALLVSEPCQRNCNRLWYGRKQRKMSLLRSRNELKHLLEKEGVSL